MKKKKINVAEMIVSWRKMKRGREAGRENEWQKENEMTMAMKSSENQEKESSRRSMWQKIYQWSE